MKTSLKPLHPQGEALEAPEMPPAGPLPVDTAGGRVHVEWDGEAAVTAMGHLVFFAEFLQAANLFDPFVEECPLVYTSPNAPQVRDVLGTMLLAALAGHRRYAHVTAIRGDTVNPALLGMTKVVSEDSVRRAFKKADEKATMAWLQEHLLRAVRPLLAVPWVLDVDSTVKPLYGKQEGAEVGYNPKKPGRPSHVYHSYVMAGTRLVLDAEVEAGNRSHAVYGMKGLWRLLDELTPEERPHLVRGDCDYGSERLMTGIGERCIDSHPINYLFKLRQSMNVKKFIERMWPLAEWADAGHGWDGVEGKLKLSGWTRERRVIVLRRAVKGSLLRERKNERGQMLLEFGPEIEIGETYEYAVLVTSLKLGLREVSQLYRDRADVENVFDELKNQWGWSGFATRDLLRCRVMTRMVALFYNWWSLFARLAVPDRHAESTTSRPLLLYGVARQTESGRQKTLKITTPHARSGKIVQILSAGSRFLQAIRQSAEQLTEADRWRAILSKIFAHLLHGRPLPPLKRRLSTA